MLDADEVRASQGERESKCARRSRGGVDGCFIRTMRGYARVGDGRIVGIDDAARERDLSAGRKRSGESYKREAHDRGSWHKQPEVIISISVVRSLAVAALKYLWIQGADSEPRAQASERLSFS